MFPYDVLLQPLLHWASEVRRAGEHGSPLGLSDRSHRLARPRGKKLAEQRARNSIPRTRQTATVGYDYYYFYYSYSCKYDAVPMLLVSEWLPAVCLLFSSSSVLAGGVAIVCVHGAM